MNVAEYKALALAEFKSLEIEAHTTTPDLGSLAFSASNPRPLVSAPPMHYGAYHSIWESLSNFDQGKLYQDVALVADELGTLWREASAEHLRRIGGLDNLAGYLAILPNI